jgi:signal transduction histidine kinase
MNDLAQIIVWLLAISMVLAMMAQSLRAGRQRSAINEALHELRRPLQAISLATEGPAAERVVAGIESSMHLATVALERLDREVNGGPGAVAREAVRCQPLLKTAVGRWRARAIVGGGSLDLHWNAGQAVVNGDRADLAQALDNLIVNAIEHGGPSIVVEAQPRGERLRILVADSGRASRPESRRGNPADVIAHLSGRRRRGHGLAVVRRVAGEHNGRFALHHSESGSLAVLELPLAANGVGRAA